LHKINLKYFLIIVPLLFLLVSCSSKKELVKKDKNLPTKIQEKIKEGIKVVPEVKENRETAIIDGIEELRRQLMMNGVPEEWFARQLQHETFQLHDNMNQYFQKSAEKQTDHDKKYDISWYFARIGVDAKIEKGKPFIEKHLDLLQRAEEKNGIHKELIAAIIGVETNFADRQQRGKFYAFNSLVSQYVFTNRRKFAVREITALYKFSEMTGRSPQYFTSSYAGAIGWGQFIPSSLLAFFIDANGRNDDIDPFSIDDTIFSVENYLYRNNLSGGNISDYNSKYKAVFAYNHSDAYVKAVLYIYDGLRNYFYPENTEQNEIPIE
jgi:membrane-bound lytic murein transglycosylase B